MGKLTRYKVNKKRNRTGLIIGAALLFSVCFGIMSACAGTKTPGSEIMYSKYSFTIHDSSYNHVFSKSNEVKLKLFGRVCSCEKHNDTFRISQSFIDSLPFNFEENIHFLGTPKIINELISKEPVELWVLGFVNNGHFKLGVLTMDLED